MRELAYLFERFPSFGQTFCYREVAELERQGTRAHVFSIRRPVNEPEEDWDKQLVDRVAARIGFFPVLLRSYTVVPLSFDLISQIISEICPEASWDSASRGCVDGRGISRRAIEPG